MEKDILTELMQKCGSRVIVNGKEEIMPITDAKTMSSVIFESAEKDAEVRSRKRRRSKKTVLIRKENRR